MNNYHPKSKQNRGQQWRKPKTPPEPAKPSVVRFLPLDKLMGWDERQKQLFIMGDGSHHVFPAKNKAQSAVWHTVERAGQLGNHKDYRVEEV
jgi:hypothetical protein